MFVKVNNGRVIDDGTTIYQPGDTFEIDAKSGNRLLKRGLVSEAETPGILPATVEEIRDAISLLDTANPKLWTQNSGPQLEALRSVLKAPVTAEQRDEAWALHKDAQK